MPSAPDAVAEPQSPAPNQPTGSWVALWRNLLRFEAHKISPSIGLRNALGVFLPLAIAAVVNALPQGVAAATGALNVAFSDGQDAYGQRSRRMLAASVMVGLAVATGSLSGAHPWTAVMVAGSCAFAAGMLVVLGNAAADIGVVTTVVVVIFAAQPRPVEDSLRYGLLAFLGGLFQTALALALWPIRRYRPERRALGDLFLEMVKMAANPPRGLQAAQSTLQETLARNALTSLSGDHSLEGERYRSLASQAERIRLTLLLLARLRTRVARDDPDHPAVAALSAATLAASRALEDIGHALQDGGRVNPYDGSLDLELEAEVKGSSFMAALLRDANRQLAALAGQIRAAVELTNTPHGVEALGPREAAQPWRDRAARLLAILRANITLESTAFRHALRLSICVALGDGLARGLGWDRSYWVPMTTAIVLKPDFSSTFTRGVLRLLGTFLGLLLATALFHLFHPDIRAQVFLIGLFTFLVRCFGPANYGFLAVAITGYVVLLFGIAGMAPKAVIASRGWNTMVGGIIALTAYWLWPTWERTQVSEALARMLDADRLYFRAIREAYVHIERSFVVELDSARQSARLARSNAEASVDRLRGEPGITREAVEILSALLANSHRLANAVMALDAGIASSPPAPARAAFRTFADHVELTLYYLAAGLRGSPLKRSQLPDLRAGHQALERSGGPLLERYALVNIETDRVTNSLNTLSEDVVRWLAVAGRLGR